jgi:hypothetical protein
MSKSKGSYIGFNRVPAASLINSAAVGVWSLREAEAFVRAGTWPLVASGGPTVSVSPVTVTSNSTNITFSQDVVDSRKITTMAQEESNNLVGRIRDGDWSVPVFTALTGGVLYMSYGGEPSWSWMSIVSYKKNGVVTTSFAGANVDNTTLGIRTRPVSSVNPGDTIQIFSSTSGQGMDGAYPYEMKSPWRVWVQ